ncbi:hypothetical protein AMTR_s00018p00195490 [Amborella trichopoda]|uniref:Uncharacterized protein n=1 Tax=Amborella trichopoda TaxID=13333 RepID=W1PM54_AMBTC|nr:hypothetical protein AMTR_s00018p00195490 [Amborella trichopoda]
MEKTLVSVATCSAGVDTTNSGLRVFRPVAQIIISDTVAANVAAPISSTGGPNDMALSIAGGHAGVRTPLFCGVGATCASVACGHAVD